MLAGHARGQDRTPLGITLPPSINFSSPPTPVGSGARAEGMGGAFVAIADDATAASWNPAGLIQLERPEISCAGALAARSESALRTAPELRVASQETRIPSLNYVSAAYPFRVLGRNMVVSLNLQMLYDFHGEVEVLGGFQDLFGSQRVHSTQRGNLYTLTPALAVQVLPSLSLGIAVNIWKDGVIGNGWEQDVRVRGAGTGVVGPDEIPFTYQGSIHESFDFFGANVTAGFLWSLGKVFTIGGVVKTPFRADLGFTHRSYLVVRLGGADPEFKTLAQPSYSRDAYQDMPLIYGFGVSARLSDRISLSADFTRTEWSMFQRESLTGGLPDFILVSEAFPAGKGKEVLEGNAGATNHVRLGGEYIFLFDTVALPVRLGFFYDPEPNVDQPDDFWGLSAGAGLSLTRFSLDAAYTFRTGEERGPSADLRIYQHRFLFSAIVYF